MRFLLPFLDVYVFGPFITSLFVNALCVFRMYLNDIVVRVFLPRRDPGYRHRNVSVLFLHVFLWLLHIFKFMLL